VSLDLVGGTCKQSELGQRVGYERGERKRGESVGGSRSQSGRLRDVLHGGEEGDGGNCCFYCEVEVFPIVIVVIKPRVYVNLLFSIGSMCWLIIDKLMVIGRCWC
jgi:hypothetical protein